MPTIITSSIIGHLEQEEDSPDCWLSGGIQIPFFDHIRLTIVFMELDPDEDLHFIPEADDALLNFLRKDATYRKTISGYAYQTYLEGEERLDDLHTEEDIWHFIQPKEIFVVRNPFDQDKMYIQVSCSCDWDEESFDLVFRQGEELVTDNTIYL